MIFASAQGNCLAALLENDMEMGSPVYSKRIVPSEMGAVWMSRWMIALCRFESS